MCVCLKVSSECVDREVHVNDIDDIDDVRCEGVSGEMCCDEEARLPRYLVAQYPTAGC